MAEAAYLSFYLGSDTIYVFCGTLKKMGCPAYVRFLVNADTMEMVMQPYHEKEFTSFRVPKALYENSQGKRVSLRIRSRAFCQLLAAKMGWDAGRSYRILGTVHPEYPIAHFDLVEAREINAGSRNAK